MLDDVRFGICFDGLITKVPREAMAVGDMIGAERVVRSYYDSKGTVPEIWSQFASRGIYSNSYLPLCPVFWTTHGYHDLMLLVDYYWSVIDCAPSGDSVKRRKLRKAIKTVQKQGGIIRGHTLQKVRFHWGR